MDSNTITVTVGTDGTARFLVSETTKGFLDERAIISRASYVEPRHRGLRFLFHLIRRVFGDEGRMAAWTRQWAATWRVNFAPINGPILDQAWEDRGAALDAEVEWLTTHWRDVR